jgi:putative DNA primase/helicase
MGATEFGSLPIGDHRMRCPRCDKGPKDDALSVTVKPDGYVFNCFRCGWAGSQRERAPRPVAIKSEPSKLERRRGLAPLEFARWNRAEKLCDTVADKYLRARRCYFPPLDGALRFLPGAFHWPTKTIHPAMLALVTDATTREPLSLHFTFLKADGSGKADVEKQKLLLPGYAIDNGVIRLWPDDCVTTGLGVAEGIETALSVAHAFRPMWASIDAGHLAKFPVLDGVEALTIFADRDGPGSSAATACAAKWRAEEREVRIFTSACGNDFNDAVRAR